MLLILLFIPLISPAQVSVKETPNLSFQHTENDPTINHRTVKKSSSNRANWTIVNSLETSQGEDFFNFFIELSKVNNTTYPLDLVILENYRESSYNTEISIFTGAKLLYKFRTLENKEYLYAAAQESIKRLARFCEIANKDILTEKSTY